MWGLLLLYGSVLFSMEDSAPVHPLIQARHTVYNQPPRAWRPQLSAANSLSMISLRVHAAIIDDMANHYTISNGYRKMLIDLHARHYALLAHVDALQQLTEVDPVSPLQVYTMRKRYLEKYDDLISQHRQLYDNIPRESLSNMLQRYTHSLRARIVPPAGVETLQNSLTRLLNASRWVERQADTVESNAQNIQEVVQTMVSPPLTTRALRLLEFTFEHAPDWVTRAIVAYDPINLEPLDHLVRQQVPVSAYVQNIQALLNVLQMRNRAQLYAENLPATLPHYAHRVRDGARESRAAIAFVRNVINAYVAYGPYEQDANDILQAWQEKMRKLSSNPPPAPNIIPAGLALLLDVAVTKPGSITRNLLPV